MKRLGIIGGLGPDATLYYYRTIVELSRRNLEPGKKHPEEEIIIYHVNQNQCADFIESGRWKELADTLSEAIERLYRAGADFAIIACNTAEMVFDAVKDRSSIPLLSIVEETCKAVSGLGLRKVGLLGTRMTMQGGFYQTVFNKENISIVVPGREEQELIHDKIITELVSGIIREETYSELMRITRRMVEDDSIRGLILGCTELPLIMTREEPGLPFFNTSTIHARAAFNYSVSS